MSTNSKGFFSTMPGLITGLAGILTAVVGLGTLLIQLGVVGGDSGSRPKPGTVTTLPGSSGTSGGSGTATTRGVTSFVLEPTTLTLKASDKTGQVTVRNTGTAPVSLDDPQLSGANPDQFDLSAGSCTATDLKVGGSCTITVSFKGGLAGSATLTVSASDGPSHTATIKGSLL